jgi:hypothetical protein
MALPLAVPPQADTTPSSGELPRFSADPQEKPDSIFADDHEEDSVFSTGSSHKVHMPDDLPGLTKTDASFAIEANKIPEAEAPPVVPPPPPPVEPQLPAPVPEQVPETTAWEQMNHLAPGPREEHKPAERKQAARGEPSTQRLRTLLLIVSLYAVLATALAIWGWWRGGDRGHPLLFIPDFFGQYHNASAGRVADLRPHLLAMGWDNTTIPPELHVRLGQQVTVGRLTVEPLAIREQKLTRITQFKVKDTPAYMQPLKEPCLTLTLRVTNHSDQTLFPIDPAYNRKALTTSPVPLTGVVLHNGEKFMGGPVVWPFASDVQRSFVTGQEADDTPLPPGASREYLLAAADRPELMQTLEQTDQPIQWQVHLRRGITRLHWKEIPVGALIAVEFQKQDIQRLN